MQYKRCLFVLFFLLFSLIAIEGKSQSKRTKSLTLKPLEKISYSRCCGGQSGSYFNFTISKDSIIYEKGADLPNRYKKIYSSITPTLLWDSLKKLIDINAFNKIKSNESHMQADGSDTELAIKKGAKIYSVINADFNRTDRTKTSLLFLFVEKILYEFSKKAENN